MLIEAMRLPWTVGFSTGRSTGSHSDREIIIKHFFAGQGFPSRRVEFGGRRYDIALATRDNAITVLTTIFVVSS